MPTWLKHAIPLVVFLLAACLFHCQVAEPYVYRSDIRLHIKYALAGEGYSLMALALRWLVGLFGNSPAWPIAIFEAFLVAGAYYPMMGICRKIVQNEWVACAIAGGLFFWSSICIPFVSPFFYQNGIVTQPWHNSTYLGMRLFAAVVMYWLFDVLPRYAEHLTFGEWIKLALSLTLATLMKPNFLMAFSPALLLTLAVQTCMDKFAVRRVMGALKLGAVVFPALAVLYVQGRIVYDANASEGASGIAFLFFPSPFFAVGFWQVFLKLFRGLALAMLVLAVHFWKNASALTAGEKFLYVQEVMGLFFAWFFVETGPRAMHGNFGWGSLVTAYLLYGVVLARLGKDILDWRRGKTGRMVYCMVGIMLALGHLMSGILYFARLMRAWPYMF